MRTELLANEKISLLKAISQVLFNRAKNLKLSLIFGCLHYFIFLTQRKSFHKNKNDINDFAFLCMTGPD